MPSFRKFAVEKGLIALTLILLGCPEPVPPVFDSTVSSVAVSPEVVTVQAGSTVSLTATIKNVLGQTLTGNSVTWTSSNQSVATVSQTGTLTGLSAGGPVTITATSQGRSATSVVTVNAGAVAPQLSVGSGDAQTGRAGQPVTNDVVVLVRDIAGNPLANIVVNFAASNGGLVSSATVSTNASGFAAVRWTLGATVGSQQLTATASGTQSRVVFSATATAAATSRLEIVTQPPTAAFTMYPLDRTPVVRLVSQNGTPIVTGQVTASVVNGGFAVRTGATESVGSDGNARFASMGIGVANGFGWAIRSSNSIRLRFDAPGVDPVISEAFELRCFLGAIPVSQPYSYNGQLRGGDCLLGDRWAADFVVDVPAAEVSGGDNAISLLVQTSATDFAPISVVQYNNGRNDEAIVHDYGGAFSTIRERFILGTGKTYITQLNQSLATSYRIATSVQPDNISAGCDVDRTYIPVQPAISFTQTLTTADCKIDTVNWSDFYYVHLPPGATITFSAEGLTSAPATVTAYKYSSDYPQMLFGATRVSGVVTNSGLTSTIVERNIDVNTRLYGFIVYSPNPATVGRYRVRVNFSRP